jgi:SAM-dependent methyltransferase
LFYVDIGCGNGWQTAYTAQALAALGYSVSTLGLDFTQRAIDCANSLFDDLPSMKFLAQDCTDSDSTALRVREEIHGDVDFVSCYFVLHDTPSANRLIRTLSEMMSAKTIAVLSLINPDWVDQRERLSADGPVYRTELASGVSFAADADWMGEYNIANSSGGGAMIPYFQRSLSWYNDTLAAEGMRIVSASWVSQGVAIEIPGPLNGDFSSWQARIPEDAQSILIVCRRIGANLCRDHHDA